MTNFGTTLVATKVAHHVKVERLRGLDICGWCGGNGCRYCQGTGEVVVYDYECECSCGWADIVPDRPVSACPDCGAEDVEDI